MSVICKINAPCRTFLFLKIFFSAGRRSLFFDFFFFISAGRQKQKNHKPNTSTSQLNPFNYHFSAKPFPLLNFIKFY